MQNPDAIGTAALDGRPPYVTIFLKNDAHGVQAMFQTFGCGFSIACCSVLTEMIAGKSPAECGDLTAAAIVDALSDIPEEKQFCADMAVTALRHALSQLPKRLTSET